MKNLLIYIALTIGIIVGAEAQTKTYKKLQVTESFRLNPNAGAGKILAAIDSNGNASWIDFTGIDSVFTTNDSVCFVVGALTSCVLVTPTSYTFTQALTEANDTVKLGGTFSEDILITGDTSEFVIETEGIFNVRKPGGLDGVLTLFDGDVGFPGFAFLQLIDSVFTQLKADTSNFQIGWNDLKDGRSAKIAIGNPQDADPYEIVIENNPDGGPYKFGISWHNGVDVFVIDTTVMLDVNSLHLTRDTISLTNNWLGAVPNTIILDSNAITIGGKELIINMPNASTGYVLTSTDGDGTAEWQQPKIFTHTFSFDSTEMATFTGGAIDTLFPAPGANKAYIIHNAYAYYAADDTAACGDVYIVWGGTVSFLRWIDIFCASANKFEGQVFPNKPWNTIPNTPIGIRRTGNAGSNGSLKVSLTVEIVDLN